MKYIFLDIDGVLNAPGDNDLIENIIDKDKYEILKEIITVDSKVIIISSRRFYDLDQEILKKIFFDIQIDFIPKSIRFRHRSDEIKEFLKNNPSNNYVILDDLDLNYSNDSDLKLHYVTVNGILGLTKNDIVTVKKILKI